MLRSPLLRLTLVGIVLSLSLGGGAAANDWAYDPLSEDQIEELRAAIEEMKRNPRGPYLRIRWFCEDGTVLPPEPYACRDHGGGHQHAELRPEIARFANWGFHFGPILQPLTYEEFADADNSGYLLRELVLQDFLHQIDDGWVLRRARYYRGARQAEDEAARGRELLQRRLQDSRWRRDQPLLSTLLAATIPHGQPGTPDADVRTLATLIAEADSDFQPLRVKLHSQPGPDDLPAVREYLRANRNRLEPGVRTDLETLIEALEATYRSEPDRERWQALADLIRGTPLAESVRAMPENLADSPPAERIRLLGSLAAAARELIRGDLGSDSGRKALGLLDVIRTATSVLFTEATSWFSTTPTASRSELLAVAGDLVDATYGSGWISHREHEALMDALARVLSGETDLTRADYAQAVRYISGTSDWGAATFEQAFGPVIERYARVEPLAREFREDAIRRSVLLPFATLMQELEADATEELDAAHGIFGREVRSGVLALNSGFARGHLRVLTDLEEIQNLDPDGIYVLPETPADLGRVAGILTLGQGSRLSHVQLLARGLGIPNTAISPDLLPLLKQHEGEEILYAVSSMGSVVLSPAPSTVAGVAPEASETPEPPRRLTIDTERLDLGVREILPLDEVDVTDSGRIVGPKAANLGRLHSLFPQRVYPGLVLPFGIFRAHIDRDLDSDGRTLHEEIVDIFATEREEIAAGEPVEQVRDRVLRSLEGVRRRIRSMPLLPEFRQRLEEMMRQRFRRGVEQGVFVRSDTNVEDLPGFSGAGLNLTVMNVIGIDAVLQAIRDVWASPFSQRSYIWRQRVVDNPAAVYPSIILLQSVPSEASGVLVTADITGHTTGVGGLDPEETWTVTVAKGIGGVVDGEAAETLLLPADPQSEREPVLVSSARAPWQKILAADGNGGITRVPAPEEETLLTQTRIEDLREVVRTIQERYPRPGGASEPFSPWDIEFGFVDDRTILFQIRPFVTHDATTTLEAVTRLDRRMLEAGDDIVDLDRRVVVKGTV